MKKFFILLLVLCLAFAGVITYISYTPMPIAEETEITDIPAYDGGSAAEESDEAAAEEAAPSYLGLDYEAILALHDEDDVVAHIGDNDVTWREYYYWLFVQANQIDSYFAQMAAYYGTLPDWNEQVTEEYSAAQLVNYNAEYMIRQVAAIENFAEENNIELTEEDYADIEARLKSDMVSMMGEETDDATFNEYLIQAHLDRDIYDRLNRAEVILARAFDQLYGENGKLADEAETIAYLDENEYINASHILFMTIDPATGEALDEDVKAEKLAQAEALVAELSAIEDKAELVERFNALKAEHCEDSGKVQFPDGYTFTPGTMVAAFEDTCLALNDYEVSGVVETEYGYHVILKLPLAADAKILTSDGQATTGRALYAESLFNAALSKTMDATVLEYAEGFESVNVADYVKE